MNFNKCGRCGCFFTSNSFVCPNCEPKDEMEIARLKNFLEEDNQPETVEAICTSTGISQKNLNRFLSQKEFTNIASQILKNDGNVSIGL